MTPPFSKVPVHLFPVQALPLTVPLVSFQVMKIGAGPVTFPIGMVVERQQRPAPCNSEHCVLPESKASVQPWFGLKHVPEPTALVLIALISTFAAGIGLPTESRASIFASMPTLH